MKWSDRIRQLQASGLTLQEIADSIGLTKSAVGDLAVERNEQPRAEAALKLHALHLQRCRNGRRPRPRARA
jgi:transcriptional regulator with XRE-family HTH domain